MELEEKIKSVIASIEKQKINTAARLKAMKNDPKLANFWNEGYEQGQEIALDFVLHTFASHGFKVNE